MKTISWILKNFGALMLFQVINYFFDLKWAIVVSVGFAICEIIWLKRIGQRITPFMWCSFAVILIFGALDFWLENAFFMKLESGLINLILAGFFGLSLLRKKSVVEELAEQQNRISAEQTPDKTFFFRLITAVWFFYYVLRAILFTWLNFSVFEGESFVVRTILGTASFYILLGASIGLSRPLWKLLLKFRLMPSTRRLVE